MDDEEINWPELIFPPINLWNVWRIDSSESQQEIYDLYFKDQYDTQ